MNSARWQRCSVSSDMGSWWTSAAQVYGWLAQEVVNAAMIGSGKW